ncbi:Na/Pi cotransporter family protein [Tianweitania sediminis]|uniref:Na/Pi cotransporter family protein n=1 Tax=Tianweitania sediminis TaxID=1502156 RepID=A0A8J7QXM4_9HYPH|nr:Na/Pi cotransporter family protein [Tianweitania sediminis]MBP0437675.1 Na/Pi cotransporter family protein [Tianweitania sediminis]
MSGSVFFLHLAGAIALLLWATRMVKTGVERAYGDVLRVKLRKSMQRPLLAVATGAGLAVAFQSSTAVTLLVGSFAGSGIVSTLGGQLAVRGAEVGSALVVRLLSFDLSFLVPLCVTAGTTIFMTTVRREWRQLGRILVGVGLLLLSLEMIGQTSEPLRESSVVPVIIGFLSEDTVTAFLLAALATWLFHSSIAAVLLLATLAEKGIVPPELGLVMVLGINLGSSIIAPVLTRRSPPAVRVVPIGNLLMRGAGSVTALAFLTALDPQLSWLGTAPADRIVNAHIAFNVLMLIAGVPSAPLVAKASRWLVQQTVGDASLSTAEIEVPSALKDGALSSPRLALGNATREVVRVCEDIEIMLERIFMLYEAADQKAIEDLAALDDRVDRRHAALKLYLARIDPHRMEDDDAERCQELLGACVKLEQVGDVIVRNMLVHVRKKVQHKLEFTEDGWLELASFHSTVLANARLAFNVLVSRDARTARELVLQKDQLREAEKETARRHFERLREGTVRSLDTSTIHLDTIRDLKQINSLLTAIAYPVLEERGLLSGSRLRAAE